MTEPVSNVIALPHGRVPPHSLDAEKSLLGGLFLDGQAIDDVLELVRGVDFYRDANRKIFEAMVDLSSRGEPIDRVQVKSKLVELGMLEAAGGDEYIDLLDQVVPTAANLGYYAKTIADKALARRIIETASTVAQLGYEQHGDAHAFADESEARFFDLRANHVTAEFKTTHELIKPVFAEIERRALHDGKLVGVTTGLTKLDEATGGLKPENLVIVAGRPSMGKSALGKGIARAVAQDKDAGGAVAYFSLEDSKEMVVTRLLSDVSGVDSNHLASGKLGDNEWGRLAHAAGVLAELPIHILSKDEIAVTEIRAHSRRLARKLQATKTPLKLIVIDYLQIMFIDEDAERRDVAIGKITRQLKGLAKHLQVPVVLLAQLNRDLEKRPDKRPRMSDLRESGSIENDADLILLLYRDEVYRPNTEEKGVAEIIIGKQRNGPTSTVRVGWLKQCVSFRDLYQVPQEPAQIPLPGAAPDEDVPPPEDP